MDLSFLSIIFLLSFETTTNWGFWTRGDTSFTHLVCWTLITCWQLPNDVLLASFCPIFNFGGVLTVLLKTSILFFDHCYWWEVDHVMTDVIWPNDSHGRPLSGIHLEEQGRHAGKINRGKWRTAVAILRWTDTKIDKNEWNMCVTEILLEQHSTLK